MTLSGEQPLASLDQRAIELIAERVADLLRHELETIAADLANPHDSARALTVGEVAERFGVARSTVYSHWREWGGYKLGRGDKAAIRFAHEALPEHVPEAGQGKAAMQDERRPKKQRRAGRELLRSRPKFPRDADAEAPGATRAAIPGSEH